MGRSRGGDRGSEHPHPGKSKVDLGYLRNTGMDPLENLLNPLGPFASQGRFVLLDFSLTVKAAPHECVIRTSQP